MSSIDLPRGRRWWTAYENSVMPFIDDDHRLLAAIHCFKEGALIVSGGEMRPWVDGPRGRRWFGEWVSFTFTDREFAQVLGCFEDGSFTADAEEWRRELEDSLAAFRTIQGAKPVGRHPRNRPRRPYLPARFMTRNLAAYYEVATGGRKAGGSCNSRTGGPFCRFARSVYKAVEPKRPAPTARTILRHLAAAR